MAGCRHDKTLSTSLSSLIGKMMILSVSDYFVLSCCLMLSNEVIVVGT
jgi:hypothetical protein